MEKFSYSDDGIFFKDYAVTPASIFPNGLVQWADVKEADPDVWPPELRLKSGEILFLSADKKEAFAVACISNKIPLVQREDIWALLLEPFLDTEFTIRDQQRTNQRLVQCGFTEREIDEIRSKIKNRMLIFNSIVWEWIHLSVYDLFMAYGLVSKSKLSRVSKNFRKKYKKDFYWWALDIANR